MDVLSVDPYICVSSIEGLIVQFAYRSAVDRISEVRTESIDVEFVCSSADLLIRSEGYHDLAVRPVGSDDLFGGGDYSRYARFVVCSKKRGSISNYNVIARIFPEHWKVIRREDDAFLLI